MYLQIIYLLQNIHYDRLIKGQLYYKTAKITKKHIDNKTKK